MRNLFAFLILFSACCTYLYSASYEKPDVDIGKTNSNDAMILVFNTELGDGTTVTLPLFGTVNVTVDWGDGNQSEVSSEGLIQHTYDSEGEYIVSISGSLQRFGNRWNTYDHAEKLTKVTSFGDLGLTSLSGAFRAAENLTEVPGILPNSVTDLSDMFSEASSFNHGIGSWDVSSVIDMSWMFLNATLSTANYNNLLIGWSGLPLQEDVEFHGGKPPWTLLAKWMFPPVQIKNF